MTAGIQKAGKQSKPMSWSRGGCETRKICHPDKPSARAAAKHMRKLGQHVRAYYCASCGMYHVGHLPRAVRAGEVTATEYYGEPGETQ